MNDEHRCRRMWGRAGALERRAEGTGDAGRAPEGDGNDADTATPGAVHRAALVAVKAVHTLIFFSMSWAVLYTLYSGLTNRISRKTGVAISAVLGEAIVFASNGWRCPLTKVAEQLGAANGTVGDIFLPKWFAQRIPQVSSTLMGSACSQCSGIVCTYDRGLLVTSTCPRQIGPVQGRIGKVTQQGAFCSRDAPPFPQCARHVAPTASGDPSLGPGERASGRAA
jgi:hypothetical protein